MDRAPEVIAGRPARERPGSLPAMQRRPRGKRRIRRTIRSVDPLSVLKVSVVFYLVMLGFWLLLVSLFYSFLEGAGLFDRIEDLSEGLALEATIEVTLGGVLRWALMLGIIFTIVASLFNVLLALLYNAISRLIGGVEVTFVERDG